MLCCSLVFAYKRLLPLFDIMHIMDENRDKIQEFILEAEELLKLRETITRFYVQRTSKPVWLVSEDMERDAFMSAAEAQAHDDEFFVIDKIKAVIDDLDWWFFSYICGHLVAGDDSVFHCQLCSRDVEHIIVRYKMKLIVEDETSTAIFVLMDNVATKLFGKTCFDYFLQLEQKIEAPYDYTILVRIVYEFINKKLLFVVDARIVGYELNTSLYVINSVCDYISFVNFLEDVAAIYDHKLFNLDGEIPHIPLEKSYGVHMYSDSLNNAISNSSDISCNWSPISVLKSNVWLVEDNNYRNIKISNNSDKVEDTTLGSICLS
ncbi:hypothetical protein Ahy_A05g025547 [Arachis hypogaea]|uniref:DUF223 domain-containing protein n=1 Tax=Arachis hypogaea TaxID=3818 RepID=A0A445D8Y1_ARAHY|nr:hypothetical protein Ahy_A05g025547 [Arachis hypogaea]